MYGGFPSKDVCYYQRDRYGIGYQVLLKKSVSPNRQRLCSLPVVGRVNQVKAGGGRTRALFSKRISRSKGKFARDLGGLAGKSCGQVLKVPTEMDG